ncbi:DUF2252 family protein [Streptomyces sp. BR123]|uniref:DUF2252 family protein n=1 Tax=Streptomyces sp. BR123 TaxID=2749828 RepID=UPI0015C4281B|nr:DUF2252 family protein [Streptomyces sp. BR123]NXY95238.1 DUF2252 family protein [Streptomyces sp. BR123]
MRGRPRASVLSTPPQTGVTVRPAPAGSGSASDPPLIVPLSDLPAGSGLTELTEPGIDGRRRDFSVRQPYDGKGGAQTWNMSPQGLQLLARACGFSLARAHALRRLRGQR